MLINRELLKARFEDGGGILHQLPGVLETYTRMKAERYCSFLSKPIYERFIDRLERAKTALSNLFPSHKFYYTTNLGAYIDALTEVEEPEFWEAKKQKKTWSGVYPNEFKLSDIDVNIYKGDTPLNGVQIHEGLSLHPSYRKNINLIILKDRLNSSFKVDCYPDKGEPKTLF